MKNTLALNFAHNMFGHIKPEIKKRLQAVIDNPNIETWDNAYTIIINGNGKMKTLWNAVIDIDPSFCHKIMRSNHPERWAKVPTRETIIKAIQKAVFVGESRIESN